MEKNIFRSQTLNSLALNFKNFISIIEIKIPGLACEQGQGAVHRGRGGKRTRGTFFTHPPPPSREVACRHYFPGNYKKNHIRHIEITVHVSYHKVTSASWPKLAPIPHWMWIQFHDFLLTCDAPGRRGGGGGEGGLNKVLYVEALPRGPNPYPFISHFFTKKVPISCTLCWQVVLFSQT